jgi:hypothetical protein
MADFLFELHAADLNLDLLLVDRTDDRHAATTTPRGDRLHGSR